MDKTSSVKINEIKRDWHYFDLKGKVLGRQATIIANLLRGKGKSYFTPNFDCGDYVVVTNASLVELTRKKEAKKTYFRYTGYVGNSKEEVFSKLKERRPEEIIRLAVKGMLPKNKLSRKYMSRLKIYRDEQHPHTAQIINVAKE